MNLSKRTIIIIGSVFALLIITLAVIGFTQKSSPTAVTPDEEGYVDPGSGEVIKSDKSPQGTEESRENAMIFPGFSKLLERGLSAEQIQSIQSTIIAYSLEKNAGFKEVSLDVSSMGRLLPKDNNGLHSVYFNITVNRKTKYFIDTQYNDTTTIKTKIYQEDAKTLLFER
jgi:hypothetical protein